MNDELDNQPAPPGSDGEKGGPTGFHEVRGAPRQSALGKYQTLVIGHRGIGALMLHELLTTFPGWLPGLLGIVLRRLLYPLLFRRMDRGVVIGVGVSLRQTSKIELSRGCFIDDHVSLSARGGEETSIVLGSEVFVGRSTVIGVRNGRIELGDHCNISGSCRVGCSGGTVRIGRQVMVGAFTYIGGGNHRADRTDIPMAQQGQDFKGGVVIGDDVWIGGGCQVLDGVTIGRGAIIGAGSVVTRDIPDYAVAYGVPARVQRTRESPR